MRHFKSISALILCAAVAAGCSDDKDDKPVFSVYEHESVASFENERFPVTFQLKYGEVEQKPIYPQDPVDEINEWYEEELLNVTVTYDTEVDDLRPYFVEVKDGQGKLITSFYTDIYIYTAVHDIRYKGDIPVYKNSSDNNITAITYARGYHTYSGKVNSSVFPVDGYIYDKDEERPSMIGTVRLTGTFVTGEKYSELNYLTPDKNYESTLKSYIQALYKELGIN